MYRAHSNSQTHNIFLVNHFGQAFFGHQVLSFQIEACLMVSAVKINILTIFKRALYMLRSLLAYTIAGNTSKVGYHTVNTPSINSFQFP